MKSLIPTVALVVLVFSSCKPDRDVKNTNRAEPSPEPVGQTSSARSIPQKPCLNLNIATAEELTKLPGIGEVIAKRIIDYRERNGQFRRPEEIIITQGLSEKKYRAIAGMVCVE